VAGTPVALDWLARRLGRAQAQPPVSTVVEKSESPAPVARAA
jgi:hypothetical protein